MSWFGLPEFLLTDFGRIEMESFEFYMIDGEVWYLTSDGRNELLDETKESLISMLIDHMMECYPDAYEALAKNYRKSAMNVRYFRFLIARRFCKCNFSNLDTTEMDFRPNTSFKFEKVQCPLRGECPLEGIVCMPSFNTKLSKKELDVMQLIYEGCSNEEVSERLYISPYTVKNHIKSVYAKLGIHEKSEFIQYANKNNLFNHNV